MAGMLQRIATDGIEPEEGAPAPDRLIAGTPRFLTWNVEERDGLYAGIWQSTPGKWRIVYDEWEYCRILEGVSIITEENGAAVTVRAGDSFVIRPGFRGTWEVVETTRKDYVIRV
jgi:Predicted enzyme of the cupin superfamily